MCDPEGMNRIFVKIGYTFDIINRIKQLRIEYNCGVYLIGIKYVDSERTEKKFHSGIKATKKELAYPIRIDGKKKDEVYLFCETLYEEFMAIIDSKPVIHEKSQINVHIEQMIKDQYVYFVKYIESISTLGLVSQISPNCNEHYKEVIIKHIETNKEKYIAELNILDNDKKRAHSLDELKLSIQDKEKEREHYIREQEFELKKIDRMLKIKELELEIARMQK